MSEILQSEEKKYELSVLNLNFSKWDIGYYSYLINDTNKIILYNNYIYELLDISLDLSEFLNNTIILIGPLTDIIIEFILIHTSDEFISYQSIYPHTVCRINSLKQYLIDQQINIFIKKEKILENMHKNNL